VFDGGLTETEQVPVVAWALVEAPEGHQYLAPLIVSAQGLAHDDARDAQDFIRVTRDREFNTSAAALKWFQKGEHGTLACHCGSWHGALCAGRRTNWRPGVEPCDCQCHGAKPSKAPAAH